MGARGWLLTLPCAALAIAACGGAEGGGSTASTPSSANPPATVTLSKPSYISQGDAVCAEVNAAVGTIGSSSSSSPASRVRQVADLYTGMVESLKRLGVPAGGGVGRFISAAETLAKAENRARLAGVRGESGALGAAEESASSALVTFQSAAHSYGFKKCSAGPKAPSPSSSGATSQPSSSSGAPSSTTPTVPATAPESTGGGKPATEAPPGGARGGGGGGSSGGIGPG